MFLIDHNYILSVSDDNCLRLWSIIDRSLISVLETNQSTKWFTRGLDEVYSALLLGENIIKFWKTNKTEYFIGFWDKIIKWFWKSNKENRHSSA